MRMATAIAGFSGRVIMLVMIVSGMLMMVVMRAMAVLVGMAVVASVVVARLVLIVMRVECVCVRRMRKAGMRMAGMGG
jgi:hypothetical protein